MASYSIPGQNLTFNLPDEGTVFRAVGDDFGGTVRKVVNGKLQTVSTQQYIANMDAVIDGKLYKAGEVIPRQLSYADLVNKSQPGYYDSTIQAREMWDRQNGAGSWSALPEFNMADIETVLNRLGGQFTPGATGYTQGVAANNPNAATITTNAGQLLTGPAPAPQAGAITPPSSFAGYTNPNAVNPTTGGWAPAPGAPATNNAPANSLYPAQIANQGAGGSNTMPSTPVGQQTPEQAAATQAATGQTPVPQDQTAATQGATTQQGTVAPPTMNLQPGNTGAAVSQLQDYLISRGLMTAQQKATGPGIYGPQTTAAVAALQKQLGVDNTGAVGFFGPKTQAAINAALQGTQGGQTNGLGPAAEAPVSQAPAAQNSANPVQSFKDTYTQLVKEAGLMDIKATYQKFIDDQIAVQKELAGKIADVNNNPWLSEGVRVKEIEKLNAKYKVELDSLTNKANYMEALYRDGLDQVQFLATGIEKSQQDAMDNAQKKLDAEAKLVETNSTIVEADGRKYLVTYDKNGNIKNQVDIGKADVGGSGGGFTPSQLATVTNALRDDVRQDPDVKDFVAIRDGYERVQSGSQLNSGPGDLALIFGYMKMLDPTSVVRETEFANAESAIGYAQKAINIPSKFISGTRLTAEGRQFFVAAAKKQYDTKKVNYDRAIDFYKSSANSYGIDPSNVVRDFSSAQTSSNSQYSPGTTVVNNNIMYLVGADGDTLTPIGSAL